MSKLKDIAPAGQVWVCGACGKYNTNRYEVGDESCMLNASEGINYGRKY